MSTDQYLTWDQADIQWDNNQFLWEEVFILIGIVDAIAGGGVPSEQYQKLDKEKKKKLVTLIAKVKGKEFKKEAYKNNDIKVIVKDIEIVANEVLGIKLKIDR